MSAAAVEPAAASSGGDRPAARLLALARELADQQQHRDAALALRRLLRLRPWHDEARHLLAECLLAGGDPAGAADLLERDRAAGTLGAGTCRAVGAALTEVDPARARTWLQGPEDAAASGRQRARHRRGASRWWRVAALR